MTTRPTVRISLLFGLSLLWEYVTIFANNKHVDFEIQFNDKLIKELRNEYSEEYYELLRDYLLTSIASMNNVRVIPGDDLPHVLPHVIAAALEVAPHSMDIVDSFNDEAALYNNYIVINTKVISGNDGDIRTPWNEHIKNNLIDLLHRYNTRVILIGEKNYSDCHEYRIHNTFCIYEDIINSRLTNIIDLTVDDTIKLYSKEIITRNLNILRKSNFNIHIGEGGGLKIFALCNNLLSLTTVDIHLFHFMNNKNFFKKSFDPTHFLHMVEEHLKSNV